MNEIEWLESERRSRDEWDQIQEHVHAQIMAESDRQEARCVEALNLTPRERWAHLQLVDDGFNLSDAGVFWPSSLACSWPDPPTVSALEVRARLAVGEG